MTAATRLRLLTPVLFLVTCVVAVISSLGAPLVPLVSREMGVSLSDAQSLPFYARAVALEPQRPDYHRWLAQATTPRADVPVPADAPAFDAALSPAFSAAGSCGWDLNMSSAISPTPITRAASAMLKTAQLNSNVSAVI